MADVYTRIGYIKGDPGATGATGAKGDQGDAATIAVGTVTTVPYGQTANVVNSGTSGAAVFDFTIPQGKPGEQTTDMQNLTLGSITTSAASFPVPAVGETGKVLWGKVVKWFSDMIARVAQVKDSADYKIKGANSATVGLNLRYLFTDITFDDGVGTLSLADYMDGYNNVSSVAMAVPRQTTQVSIVGCRVDASTKVLTLNASRLSGTYSGTISINIMFFVY